MIGFGCSPENLNKLLEATLREIEDVKKNGCAEKNLTKIKETFRREREFALKENFFWQYTISNSAMHGESPLALLQYDDWVNNLKAEDFKEWAYTYFNMSEFKKFVLLPEKILATAF